VTNGNNYPSIEQLERAKELNALKKAGVGITQEESDFLATLDERYLNVEEAVVRIQKTRLETNAVEREELETLTRQAEKLENIASSEKDRKELAQLQLEIAEKDYALKLKTESTTEDELRTAKARVETAEELNEKLEKTAAIAGKIEATFKRAFSMKESADFIGKIDGIMTALAEAESVGGAFNEVLTGIGTAGINNIAGLALKLYDAENAFRKTTGASEAFASSITEVYESTRETGATIADVSAAMESLYVNYTDFTMQTKATREEIADVGTTLGMLGVKQDSFGQGMQNATKMFGVSSKSAAASMLEITAHAKDLGLSPAQMTSEFATAGGQLAKFGDQGMKAFKDLQMTAKITGMEMNKILQLTNKFDTFEEAAGMAGKLNAALGGNFVNAMDMMMETDPDARFGMIRDAITNAGLSFDTMSYYQRQFYTESLGLNDVGDLAMMLSGKMDGLAGDIGKTSKELTDMKEEAAKVQDLQTELNALLAEAAVILAPLIKGLRSFVSALQEYKDIVIPIIKFTMAWVLAQKALQAIGVVLNALRLKSIALIIKETFQKIFNAAATDRQSQAEQKNIMMKKNLSKVSVSAALNMLAFGAALYMVGAGIGLAATGIGNMADGVSMLNTEQLVGFTTALAMLGVTIIALAHIMGAMALNPLAQAGVTFLLAFGVAVMAIGAGVMLASVGIGEMAKGFGKLVSSFSGLGDVIYNLLELIEVSTEFTTLAKDFENIAKAIDSIPETKAVAVAMTMTAAAEAAMGTAPTVITKNIKAGAANLNVAGGGGGAPTSAEITLKLDAAQTRKLFTDGVVTKDEVIKLIDARRP